MCACCQELATQLFAPKFFGRKMPLGRFVSVSRGRMAEIDDRAQRRAHQARINAAERAQDIIHRKFPHLSMTKSASLRSDFRKQGKESELHGALSLSCLALLSLQKLKAIAQQLPAQG
jgi:hypothetical protein